MDKLGFKEGEVLEHNMLSKSVERAQKKVEENNFGIRKRLLEYDDVMNSQRNVIYTRRRHALMGERIGLDVLNTIYDTSTAIADQHARTSRLQVGIVQDIRHGKPVHGRRIQEHETGATRREIVRGGI